MEGGGELPITGVCIVSDPGKCPPNYTIIDRTQDRPEDADLWKDGIFTRRVMRYLCIEKDVPTQGKDVLVDVALINERDIIPPGFTILENTRDSGEKATKKKYMCVRWMVPSMTNDSITDLILLTRNQRRAPTGYTLVGELNNMSLCYKMGKLPPTVAGGSSTGSTPSQEVAGFSTNPQAFMHNSGPGLPYGIAPTAAHPTEAQAQPAQTNQSTHTLGSGPVHVLSGVEWKMNPRYSLLMEMQDLTIPEIRTKTMMDLENEYSYDFNVERAVSKTASSLT